MAGPLSGFRIVELAGIGAGPFCGMMLADMGAEVIRIDRPGGNPMAAGGHDILFRSRRAIAVNLKHAQGAATVLRLCEKADALVEAFRPGVAERLGVGPADCMARNPKLVYGRMTGWGQQGPLANAAGHDINYIAIAGALHAMGRAGERPAIPLNLVGDFGGGLLGAYGIVCALLEATKSGRGQVVDAAMLDAASSFMAMWWGFRQQGLFDDAQRGAHMLDSGAHFYEVYETADGKALAIGAIEPQFYALLRDKLGLGDEFREQMNVREWPRMKEKLASIIRTKTRAQWATLLEGTDACVSPVLSLGEAAQHPHNVARAGFVQVAGATQPAPAPRFSRSAPEAPRAAGKVGKDTRAVLMEAGFAAAEINALAAAGAIACVDENPARTPLTP